MSGKLVLDEVGNQPLGLTLSDAAASVPPGVRHTIVEWADPLARLGQAQRRHHGFERHVRQWTDEDPAPHDQEASEDNCGQRCLAALSVAKSGGFQSYVML